MRFKDLPRYMPFNFDHTDIPFANSFKQGPWIKISARKYVLSTNPFSLKADERRRHEENIGLEYEVGTINVKVLIV